MFVPVQVRLWIRSLCTYFAVDFYCMKEIFRWDGLAVLLGKIITNADLEEKLLRRGWLRNSDWKKTEWLYGGWGDSDVSENSDDMKDIAHKISKGRIRYWRRREFSNLLLKQSSKQQHMSQICHVYNLS